MENERKYKRRAEAADYLKLRYGFGSTQTLAKLASVGGGPVFQRYSRFPVYTEADLDALGQVAPVFADDQHFVSDRVINILKGKVTMDMNTDMNTCFYIGPEMSTLGKAAHSKAKTKMLKKAEQALLAARATNVCKAKVGRAKSKAAEALEYVEPGTLHEVQAMLALIVAHDGEALSPAAHAALKSAAFYLASII